MGLEAPIRARFVGQYDPSADRDSRVCNLTTQKPPLQVLVSPRGDHRNDFDRPNYDRRQSSSDNVLFNRSAQLAKTQHSLPQPAPLASSVDFLYKGDPQGASIDYR